MKAHIIGICGVGMSATALLLKEAGYEVSGSDAGCYGPPGKILSKAGITPSVPYSKENIPPDVSMFVIGRNAKLSPTENAEVQEALTRGMPVRSFPEVIGELTKGRDVVAVVGSYGKSTTTSLIAHILQSSLVPSGYFIGAEPLSLPSPAKLGSGVFVAEGDEYPSAHDDPRAKFMHLNARDVVFTSAVHDHVNVYPTLESYHAPFASLLASLPADGMVVVCTEEPYALSLANASGKRIVTYGISSGEYHAANIVYKEHTTFSLVHNETVIADLETSLLGTHNIEVIVAASAYVLSRKLVSIEMLQQAILSFTGVRRRLDRVTKETGFPTYEGFGSSYEKARSALLAIKTHFPTQPITVVFEPHTFGWRNQANLHWYDDVFSEATRVFVASPETQGSKTHDQLSHEEILARVAGTGVSVFPYNEKTPLDVTSSLEENAVVLILTSGDLHGSIGSLIQSLQTK